MIGRARLVAWCCLVIATPRLSGPTPDTDKRVVASWLDRYDLATPARIIRLPGVLKEASGLAVWDAAHLLSHNDQQSALFLFRVADGKIVREIGIGRRHGLRGDYEELVLDGRQGYLLRSDGALLEFSLDDTSMTVSARQDVSMEAAGCELESLARDVSGPGLIAVWQGDAPRSAGAPMDAEQRLRHAHFVPSPVGCVRRRRDRSAVLGIDTNS